MGVSTTFLTSMLSLFMISGASFLTVFTIFKNRNKTDEDIAFANCWLTIGVVFFLIALRTAFFGIGLANLDEALAYVVQVFLVLIFVSIGYYTVSFSLDDKNLKTFFYFFIFLLAFLFFYFLISIGLQDPLISDWGTEYTAPLQSNVILVLSSLLASFLLVYSLIKKLKVYKTKPNNKKIIGIISLLLLLIFGTLEQLGNVGWQVLMIRIFILFSVLIAYSAYELEKYKL